MNPTANMEDSYIESIIRTLRQLAESEGISVEPTDNPGLRSPAEGIPLRLDRHVLKVVARSQ